MSVEYIINLSVLLAEGIVAAFFIENPPAPDVWAIPEASSNWKLPFLYWINLWVDVPSINTSADVSNLVAPPLETSIENTIPPTIPYW